MLSWEEMVAIAEQLKPASISYAPVDVTKKAPPIPPYQQYRRNN
jgi:hypothetical protein